MITIDNRYAYDERQAARRGGMAQVVQAMDVSGRRTVAIKFVEDDPALRLAFDRESKALQTLRHPNIVDLLDGGRDPDTGRLYLVLEWLDRDLVRYLAEQPLAGWDDFFERVGRPILAALQCALGQGWIHRDLKPSNVLVNDSGDLKVSDFGISRLIREPRLGQTLQDRRSEPYAPPESDSGVHETARDVYSFAVLALQCLIEEELLTRDSVLRVLSSNDADLPHDVLAIFERCLSDTPGERPENASVLSADLERIYSARSTGWDRRSYYVQVSSFAHRGFQKLMPKLRDRDVPARIVEELNGALGFRLRAADDSPTKRFQVRALGQQFEFSFELDPQFPGCLLVAHVRFRTPSDLDLDGESSWSHAGLRFTEGRPQDPETASKALRAFLEELGQNEARLKELQVRAEDDRLMKEWRNLLAAREQISQGAVRPIRFSALSIEGSRLHLKVQDAPQPEILDQAMIIPLQDRTNISGIVEEVRADEVVLFVDRLGGEQLPRSGELRVDNRASRAALSREMVALDAVRARRSLRGDLRDLLTYPNRCTPPTELGLDDPRQKLDPDQSHALESALATKDIFVLEGPPGTGKTRVIAELILQLCGDRHSKKVLLCSQTHVALDNALERAHSLDPELRLVRVGHRGDPRIASASEPFLLHNLAREWAKRAGASSEAFILKWAKEQGLDTRQVTLGIAASHYRAALHDQKARAEQVSQARGDLGSVRSQFDTETKSGIGDRSPELAEGIQGLDELLQELREQLAAAELEVTRTRERLEQLGKEGKELASASLEDLTVWEELLLGDNPAGGRFRELRALIDEWQLRLARADDFHRALLRQADVVAATCIGFAGLPDWQDLDFDCCIIDEASKALPTELLVPMSRARAVILVGDPRQLPPFLDDDLRDPDFLESHGLQRTSLERTLLTALLEGLPSECLSRLTFQHRMVPAIGQLISECFYDGALKSTRPEATLFAPVLQRPVTWVSTSSLAHRREIQDGCSYRNAAEVRAVVDILKQLDRWMDLGANRREQRYSVVCLAGYLSQVRELQRAIAGLRDLKHFTVTCASVDAYQGREADVCIYSVTRSNEAGRIGFLAERRRLNVALSRGRDQLVLVGDLDFVSQLPSEGPFRELTTFLNSHPTSCSLREAPQ